MNIENQEATPRPDLATDHILGPESARATLIEYGDLEAPLCGQAHHVIQLLMREFPRELRVIYRHFPETGVHPHAELAAEASEAAGAQGQFWAYLDVLFEHQDHLKEKALRAYAEQIELDLEKFDYAMRERIYLQRVQEHCEGARQLGIRAMPSFFLNGHRVDITFGLHHLAEAVGKVLGVKPKAEGYAQPAPNQ